MLCFGSVDSPLGKFSICSETLRGKTVWTKISGISGLISVSFFFLLLFSYVVQVRGMILSPNQSGMKNGIKTKAAFHSVINLVSWATRLVAQLTIPSASSGGKTEKILQKDAGTSILHAILCMNFFYTVMFTSLFITCSNSPLLLI